MKDIVFVEFLKDGKAVAYFVGKTRLTIINDAENIGINYNDVREVSEKYMRSLFNVRFLDEGIQSIQEGIMKSFVLLIVGK